MKVFDEVEGNNLCNAFVNGQNCTIFVYGPTSTGKTFTMQGNAEDIINGNSKEALGGLKSQNYSYNVSPDYSKSNISHLDDSVTELDLKGRLTPQKGNKRFLQSAHKLSGVSKLSLYHRKESNGRDTGLKEDSSQTSLRVSGVSPVVGTKHQISRVAKDMMLESHNKGIIQRVIDQIYEKFSARQDLESNCQIKIAFIEIYKDSVTDLLEDH